MQRFQSVLATLNDRLVLPQPLKYRVMKEIAADLEDIYSELKSQGFSDADAENKALQVTIADDQVIEQLIDIHETPVRKTLRKLSDKTQHLITSALLIVFLVVIGILLVRLMVDSRQYYGSIFNWITGICILIMSSLSIRKYYSLYIKNDHSLKHLHSGLPDLIFLALLVMTFGALGFLIEMRHALQVYFTSDVEAITNALPYFYRSFTIISFSLAASLNGAIIWLMLSMKTLAIEEQEHAFTMTDRHITPRRITP